jgi:hypothetical protein
MGRSRADAKSAARIACNFIDTPLPGRRMVVPAEP